MLLLESFGMSSSVAMILVGTALIASGGLIATLGWNKHSEDRMRQGLIDQVTAELTVNVKIVMDPKFNEIDPDELDDYVVFPRFQTVAIDAAIGSGLFLRARDRELLTRLSGLSETLRDFNNRLGLTESQMIGASTNVRTVWRTKLRDGATRKGIEQRLRELGALLLEKYKVPADREFFVELGGKAA